MNISSIIPPINRIQGSGKDSIFRKLSYIMVGDRVKDQNIIHFITQVERLLSLPKMLR